MEQDVEALLDECIALGLMPADLDRRTIQYEIDELLAEHLDLPLRDIPSGTSSKPCSRWGASIV